jgi:glutathione synthase
MALDDPCTAALAASDSDFGTMTETGGIFMLGDPEDGLDQEWDSSLRLMAAHRRRGDDVAWVTCDDILIRGRTLLLGGTRIGPKDVVWLRLDPSVSVRWYETLRALCHVDARIINPPEAVLTVHDKRAALAFSPRCSWSVFSAAQLTATIGEMRHLQMDTAVLKPPSLFGSKGVRFLPVADAAAIHAAFDDLIGLFGYVIVEPYLGPGNNLPPTDIRVLMTGQRVLGVIERIIPPGGDELQDVQRGGPLTPTQSRVVAEVQAFVKVRGIVVAGLDFIGDILTEINVSCPGAIPEVNMFCHIQAEDMILDDLGLSLHG